VTVPRIPSITLPPASAAGTAAARRAASAPHPRAPQEPELAGALTEEERAHFLVQPLAGPATYAPARPGAEAVAATLGRRLDVRA
jgi:hypothetical protein